MKILGISAGRRMGNCELLTKYALKGAEDAGCEVSFLCLQDYRILPCTGCEACIRKKVIAGQSSTCSIPDDADDSLQYVRQIMEADGLIFAAPCYNLTAAGRALDVLNRQHRCLSQLRQRIKERPKYAATIGVGGTDWTNYLMPMLNFMATEHCGGKMHLADQMLAEYAPSPGAVLLDEASTGRAYRLGANLAKAVTENKGRDAYLGDKEEVCPICHGDHLQLRGGKLICPACDVTGHVTEKDGKVTVSWEQDYEASRWSAYGEKRHLDGIRNGHARAAENMELIRTRAAEWQDRYPAVKPDHKQEG